VAADIHYAPPSVCTKQRNVPQDATTKQRGCFLLTHDPPVATKSNYASSDDILAYLIAPQRIAAFQASKRLYIALCFKVDDELNVCDGTKRASADWMFLADELVAIYTEHIEAYKLNVEFILDGTATGTYPRARVAPSSRGLLEPHTRLLTCTKRECRA